MLQQVFHLTTIGLREKFRFFYVVAAVCCLLWVLWISEVKGRGKSVFSISNNVISSYFLSSGQVVYRQNGDLSLFCSRCRRYPDVEISNLSACIPCYERVTNESLVAKARNKLLLNYHEKAKTAITREQRLPNVIGIGVRKCGTSWLQHVLRKHPMIKTNVQHEEMHFFNHRNRYEKGIDFYRSLMPYATEYEITMEKTPGYFNFPHWDANIPALIHKHLPNAKLWVILCDPAYRALSDFVHVNVTTKYQLPVTFEKFIDEYLPSAREILGTSEDLIKASYWWRERDYLSLIFTLGIYHPMMNEWLRYFPAENIHVISGEEMIANPGVVVERLQDFLGVPRMLLAEDFEKNPKTGLYCISPTLAIDSALYRIPRKCILTRFKGRTRAPIGSSYTISKKTFSRLREFYEPFNEELFKILRRRLW